MEMTALLEEMVSATPQSPGPEVSSALEEAPEVQKKPSQSARKRKADGCMKVSFGQLPSRSPSPDPPEVLMSPRRVMLPELELADATEKRGAAGRGKGEADEPVARPSKVLRMQMRRAGKGMNGGSSAHNAAPLQRSLSVYVPFERMECSVSPPPALGEDAVTRIECSVSSPPALGEDAVELSLPVPSTPPDVCRVDMDTTGLASLKSMNLDMSFGDLQMFDAV